MRQNANIGIGTLLAFCTAAATLALTVVMVVMIGGGAADQVEADIGQGLAELAFQSTDKLDRGMQERYREVRLMAERHEITSQDVPASAKRRVLDSMQQTYPDYAWIGLTDNRGKVLVASQGMLEGADVSRRPWYAAAYRDENLTDVHEAVLLANLLPNPSNEPKRFFDIAFPYRDANGEILGILGTHLSWQWARDIEASVLTPLVRRKAVEGLIVGRQGHVLLGPPHLVDTVLKVQSLAAAGRQHNGYTIETWPDGKRYLVGYSRSRGGLDFPGLDWTVLVRQDLDDAYRPVVELKQKIFWGGVAASVLISLLLWVVARRVTGPLRAITRHADALRLGDAQAIAPVGSRLAEVGILERALNALVTELRAKEESLREANATLESRVDARTRELHQAVQDTRAGERRVRAIVETAHDAFVGVDAAGAITDWNPRAQAIFGWRRDEVLGRAVVGTIIPARYARLYRRGIARGRSGDRACGDPSGGAAIVGKLLHLSALRRDGDEFPVEMTVGLIDAGDGQFFGAFIQDISARRRIEDELARERELLDTVLDTIDVGVVVCSADGDIALLNRAAREMHGLPATPIPPERWAEHYDLFAADGATRMAPEQIPLFRALSGEIVKNAEMMIQPKDGPPHFLLASGRALHTKEGAGIGAVIAMNDVSELKASERRLEAGERLLRTITDNLPVLIAYIDGEERYRFVNETYRTWFGVPAAGLLGKTVGELLDPATYAAYRDGLHRALAGHPTRLETQMPTPGGILDVDIVSIPDTADGVTRGIYVLTSDITAAKRQEAALSRLARVDSLTGLPNRRNYEERLHDALARTGRSGRGLALMYLDVDRFKGINDTFGHAGGDAVLQEAGRRLKAAVRGTDVVSRLAGDEFTIIVDHVREPEEAERVAAKIVEAFAAPVRVGEAELAVSTSIGIAFTRDPSIGIAALSQQADAALYRAKVNGRAQYCLFGAA